ncbi:MAG TPA: hypothetical protein VGX48_16450 [Pyrinomonadaceae bacterium]|jgi:hypothetical protein|nr:hypothetical protein [Pyrinomonadaceae bacterium]
MAFLLALAAIAGATLLTYLYDEDALFWSRLCAGVCVGLSVLGLLGFVAASLLGMTPAALALAGALSASPVLLLARGRMRRRVVADAAEGWEAVRRASTRKGGTGVLVFYVLTALLFYFVFARAMFEDPSGVYTGVDTNIGDLPFHVAIISGFVRGENFPPQHPEFAGARLTYPFIVDFVTAMFMRAGAGLQGAMFWQGYATMLALVGLLHRWALKLTRDRAAALLTVALVLLSGGFGWAHFLSEALKGGQGVFGLLFNLGHDYTRAFHNYQWANAVTALFVPQRGILLGVALAVAVFTLWWQASGKIEEAGEGSQKKAGGRGNRAARRGAAKGKVETGDEGEASFAFCLSPFALRPLVAAGLMAGLLPLIHAHSFVVVMLTGACLALIQAGVAFFSPGGDVAAWRRAWRTLLPWLAFAGAASLLAVPQMLWATRGSEVRAGQFFGWQFGWDHGEENVVWFWLKNTGPFIPLLVAALLWRGRRPLVSPRLLYFFAPFTLCFVVPNVYRLSPWIWDNIKVLFYWWVASAPLVALMLARMWRRGGVGWRAAALALLLAQTGAGALDVWRVASGATQHTTFEAEGVGFAQLVERETPPRSLILHAPTYNDPVYLTGRRTYLGYPGHVGSHGLDYTEREANVRRIYAGGADAAGLIARERIEYVVVGPLEREEMRKYGVPLNERFFERFRKVGGVGEYRLYKTAP